MIQDEDLPGNGATVSEIGELPLALQPKLLRALQEKEVRPVGSSTTVKISARIVSATHRDLEAAVAGGSFRRDLYYRLNVIQIVIPPLRDRREDIPLLVSHFLARQPTPRKIDPEALEVMQAHSWPGNVRELQNCIERACALGAGETIGVKDLPREVRSHTGHASTGGTIADLERQAIEAALKKTGGNRRAAATMLGMGEATLYRRLKQFGLPG